MNRQINLAKSAAHPQRPEGRADALIVHRPRSLRKALRGCLSEAARGATIRTGVRIGGPSEPREWRTRAVLVDKLRSPLDNRNDAGDEGTGSVREAWTAGTGVSTRCSDGTTLQTTRCSGLGLTRAPRRQYI